MLGNLADKISGIRKAMKGVGGNFLGEKCFPVTDRIVNFILEKNLGRLSETVGAEFRSVQIKSAPDGVNVAGKVTKKDVGADFFLKVLPLPPIWLRDDHQVRFTVIEKSLNIDRKNVRGILASLGNSILGAVTDNNLLELQLHRFSDKNGIITFGLDGLDKQMDRAMSVLRLTSIRPVEGRILVMGRLSLEDMFAKATVQPGAKTTV